MKDVSLYWCYVILIEPLYRWIGTNKSIACTWILYRYLQRKKISISISQTTMVMEYKRDLIETTCVRYPEKQTRCYKLLGQTAQSINFISHTKVGPLWILGVFTRNNLYIQRHFVLLCCVAKQFLLRHTWQKHAQVI